MAAPAPPASLHIIMLGCGKMGSALLKGWLQDDGLNASFTLIEPMDAAVAWVPDRPDIQRFTDSDGAVRAGIAPADFVLLSVKPQMMAEAATGIQNLTHSKTAYLSIAAGLTCEWLSQQLGDAAHILRSMPNIPASVGKGMTALYANSHATAAQTQIAVQLLGAVGDVVILDDEALMNAVTALSGSGPAYVFLLAEVMAAAGKKLGLPDAMALQLARQTIVGAGAMLEGCEDNPAILRESVTSKGGTTAAALTVLRAEDGMAQLLERAMQAAHDRSTALGS